MIWMDTVPRSFSSRILRTDEEGTGKWLVPIPLGDPDGNWTCIREAAETGRLWAAKMSGSELDGKLGHHLVCVYCRDSSVATVSRTLAILRSFGVDGDLRYKADLATYEDREESLHLSGNLEAPSPSVP